MRLAVSVFSHEACPGTVDTTGHTADRNVSTEQYFHPLLLADKALAVDSGAWIAPGSP